MTHISRNETKIINQLAVEPLGDTGRADSPSERVTMVVVADLWVSDS